MSEFQGYAYFQESMTDRVTDFAQQVFASLARADQRRWAEVYLRGLMCVEGKKSIRRIAENLVPHPAVQSLQQFVNQSPWDWRPVCHALRDYVVRSAEPTALSVGIVHVPKRGFHSVGVRRRFVREADRLVNAQIGVGLFLTSQQISVPVSWRIVLDERWSDDRELRRKASVPDGYRIKSENEAIVDMADEYADLHSSKPLLADLRGARGFASLAARLSDREQEFLIEVDGAVEGREWSGGGGAFEHSPMPLRALRDPAGHRCPVLPIPVDGMHGRPVVTALVRLADSPGPVRAYRVIAELATAPGERARYWITNVVDHGRWSETRARMALQDRHRAELDDFRGSFGVADFEGRSFLGWQHHMTLSSAAFAGSRLVCAHQRGVRPENSVTVAAEPLPGAFAGARARV